MPTNASACGWSLRGEGLERGRTTGNKKSNVLIFFPKKQRTCMVLLLFVLGSYTLQAPDDWSVCCFVFPVCVCVFLIRQKDSWSLISLHKRMTNSTRFLKESESCMCKPRSQNMWSSVKQVACASRTSAAGCLGSLACFHVPPGTRSLKPGHSAKPQDVL